MSSKKREFITGGHISPGRTVWLDAEQADARRHNLVAEDKPARGKRRCYQVKNQIYFKAGEIIQIEGRLDRRLAILLGEQTEARERTEVEGKQTDAENRAKEEARARLTETADAVAKAEAELAAAGADAEKSAAAQTALDEAKAVAESARAAADDLGVGDE